MAWKPVSAMNQSRRALASAANANYVYAIGGISDKDKAIASVEFARVLATGELSAWRYTVPLPQARIYAAATVLNQYLYVLGGGIGETGSANQPTAVVIRAKILKDGSLGPWTETTAMTSARRGLKVVTFNKRIYAIGGYDGRFLKSTELATLAQHNRLSPWKESPQKTNLDRYIHAVAQNKDTLYVIGGHRQQNKGMSAGDVESTQIQQDGDLKSWFNEKSRLNKPRFIAAAFSHRHFLYILGGHNGGKRLKSIEFAPIYADGHLGQFEYTTPLAIERSASTVTRVNNYIYVLGGMSNRGSLNNVEMCQVRKNGHLAHIKTVSSNKQ
ncbi:MAG: Kelch repeat-containing protein [Thiohalomonadales bacterium]